MSSSSSQDLSLAFLEQRGIRDSLERQLVLDALNKNGKVYTVERLLKLFEEGGGVSKLISWGIHETYAKDLENFWKQQPIDFEFLKRLGIVEPDDQQVVLRALEAAKIRTYSGLLSTVQEGPESQEVSRLTQKWMINDVFVQMLYKFWRAHNATKFAAPAGQKKLKLINSSFTGFPKFLKQMLNSNPINFEDLLKADREAKIVDLGCHLNDEDGQPDKIYFRKCYYSYFNDHVLPIFEAGKNILIGGAKGIGKSVFSIILAMLLFGRGHIVLLDRYGIKFLLVPTNCNPELLMTIKNALLDQQIDPSNLPSDEKIFEVPDDKAFLMLGRIKEIVLVQDIGDDPNIVLLNNGQGRKIWVTSPNSSKLKNPLRENLEQRAEIYLPPWELDEVLFVNKHVYSDKWSTETLKQRFNLIGGNLRLLFFAENLMEDYQKAWKKFLTSKCVH